MLKKNSWIVALLLALSFTAMFSGCAPDLEQPDDTKFTEVALGKFNTWGGQDYQKGWAPDGYEWYETGVPSIIASPSCGYKNEDFVNARYLVIEMPDASTSFGDLNIILGGDKVLDAAILDKWGSQTPIQEGVNAEKEGNKLKIDLTKLAKYQSFKKVNRGRIIVQKSAVTEFVVSATLLVVDPSTAPYKSANKIGINE